MSTNILPFALRSAQPAGLPGAAAGALTWRVRDLPDRQQCGAWLDQALEGQPHQNTAVSLWTHHPNLRTATEKLASFIPPQWPDERGQPLLVIALQEAIRRVDAAILQGQAFEGRLVGLYLFGLLTVHRSVGRLVVRGMDRHGQLQHWQHFAQPLLSWSCGHGIEQLVVSKVERPTEEFLHGLYVHMLAAIASPVDAGYLAKHAARG